MTRVRPVPLTALALVGLVLAGCSGGSSTATGSGSGDPTAADLDGTTYVSSSVEGHDLVPGTQVSLEFHDGRMAASAGCNTMSAGYAVTDGRLTWTSPPATTLMGCTQERMDQDTWLTHLLTAGVDASLDGHALTLTSGDVTLHLAPPAPADAASLFGHTWTVTELTTPSSASTVPEGVRTPTFEVSGDGSVQLDTGCNRGHTRATAQGDVLTFGPVALTRMACPGASADVEQAVLQALEGRVSVTVDGDTASLSNGHHGLMVQLGPLG